MNARAVLKAGVPLVVAAMLTGCVYESGPPAPYYGPGYYAAAPGYYAPGYYAPGYYGPTTTVGIGFGFGGHDHGHGHYRHHWR